MGPLLYQAAATLLALGSAILLIWAVRGDRARGRPRCPRCWYSMAGAAAGDAGGFTCPECGHTARSPAHLLRTRRRWTPALAALALAAAAYATGVWPRVHKAGAMGLVPTTVLIWCVPSRDFDEHAAALAGTRPSAAADELARRIAADGLWRWQWRSLLSRCCTIQHREAWPVHVPLHVRFGLPGWLHRRADASSPLPGATDPTGWPFTPWRIGRIDASTREATISIWPRGVPDLDGRRTVLWPIPVRPVERTEDAIQPVSTPELDAAVQRAARIMFDHGRARALQQAGRLPLVKNWGWSIRLDRQAGPIPDDIALGFAVDLLDGGEVIRTWSVATGDLPYADMDFVAFVDGGNLGWGPEIPEIDRYTIRVRGDPDSAVADVTRPRCWAGEFTIPLADTIRRPN